MKSELTEFFDVLFIINPLEGNELPRYEVQGFGAETERAKASRLKKLAGTHTIHLIGEEGRAQWVKRKFVTSGKPGEFDHFIGKNAGDFIKEHLQLALPIQS